jgi:predicted DNA-binding transcriptional regulator AlpA
MEITNQNALTLGETFLELMRQAVREEIRTLIEDLREKDRLLTAQEAARMLAVSPDWLYRNAKRLPFTHQLAPKMLRFSRRGIEKWIATRGSSARA